MPTGQSLYRNGHLKALALQSAHRHVAVHFIVREQHYFTVL